MVGSIREREPGVWEVRAYAGSDARGRPRQVSRTVRGGIRKARDVLRQLEVDVRAGEVGPSAAGTVNALASAYITGRAPELSPATVSLYRLAAKRIEATRLGAKQVDRVRPGDVDDAYGEMRAAGLSAYQVSQAHRFLRSAWRDAVRRGDCRTNPVRDARAPRLPRKAVTAPAPESVAAVLREVEARDPDAAAVLLLGALTGLRRGALCGLQWGDLEDGGLVVRRSIALVDGAPIIRPPKMRVDGEFERVVLGDLERSALAGLLALVEERRRSAGLGPVGAEHYVLSPDGLGTEPVDPAVLNRRMRDACRRLGLPRMSPHDLRHFAATEMVAAGVPIDVVARRLHHKDPAVTLRVYSHPSPADELRASEAVAALLA